MSHSFFFPTNESIEPTRRRASGVALARTLLDTYATAPLASRLSFLTALADRFGPDHAKLFAHVYASPTPQLVEQAELVADELSRAIGG